MKSASFDKWIHLLNVVVVIVRCCLSKRLLACHHRDLRIQILHMVVIAFAKLAKVSRYPVQLVKHATDL